ncbi:unnamed protein product, partial [marine sediment metagenome]
LLFDFTKQGAFDGALEDFHGNWSDWINLCLEDYFTVGLKFLYLFSEALHHLGLLPLKASVRSWDMGWYLGRVLGMSSVPRSHTQVSI